MTDTELLDGLQRLFDRRTAALRSCRSGVKVDVAMGDLRWGDATDTLGNLHEYFGGQSVRQAVEQAVLGEGV